MEAGGYDPDIRILLCRMHRLTAWHFDNLAAPYWRLYWNDRPGASVRLGARWTELRPSRFALIPPETPYAARLERPVTHFYLHFQAAPPFDAVAPAVLGLPAAPEMLRTVREIRGLLEAPAAGSAALRLALLCHCLAGWALAAVPAGLVPPVRTDGRVAAALRLMERELAAPPDNQHLAAAAGMSTNAFIRLFRQVVGRSPQAHLVAKRVERACLMLQGSDLGIKEVAAATGFCDRYHFSRVFKRLRGVGPAEFRRRCY